MISEGQWGDDMFYLLIFSSSGTAVRLPVADGPDWLMGGVLSVTQALLVCLAAVICPCAVGIGYKSRALTRSSSFHATPVTGSLLFYVPVCRLTVCCAVGFSSWVVSGLLCLDCFSGELVCIV